MYPCSINILMGICQLVLLQIHSNIYNTLNEQTLYLNMKWFGHVPDWLNLQLLIARITVYDILVFSLCLNEDLLGAH